MSHNLTGDIYALTLLSPVKSGQEGLLRSYLRALPRSSESPLARLGRVHFARWLVLPQVVFEGPPQRPDRLNTMLLLFSATVDGPDVGPFLDDMYTHIPHEADEIWGHCVGYPGTANPVGFKDYMLRCEVDSTLFYAAYLRTVDQVRDSLRLQRRLSEFVVGHQACDAESLWREWRDAFPRSPEGTPA